MRAHPECSFCLRKHQVLASRTYSLELFLHQYDSTKCFLNAAGDFLLLPCKIVSDGFLPYAADQRLRMRLILALCLARSLAGVEFLVSLIKIVSKTRFIWDLQLKSSLNSFQSQLLVTS